MLYETDTEMREVIGTLEENPFIQKQNEKLKQNIISKIHMSAQVFLIKYLNHTLLQHK